MGEKPNVLSLYWNCRELVKSGSIVLFYLAHIQVCMMMIMQLNVFFKYNLHTEVKSLCYVLDSSEKH